VNGNIYKVLFEISKNGFWNEPRMEGELRIALVNAYSAQDVINVVNIQCLNHSGIRESRIISIDPPKSGVENLPKTPYGIFYEFSKQFKELDREEQKKIL
jgi:hypothetical protein